MLTAEVRRRKDENNNLILCNRGRLNVLANVVRKELDQIFSHFDSNLRAG